MALTRITKGVIKPNENYDTHNINSTGIVTAVGGNFTGDLTVGGVLTYEDVTSVDSVGLITARDGIFLPNNKHISFGTGNDMRIYSAAGGLNNSFLKKTGTGPLNFDFQGDFLVRNTAGSMRAKFTGPLGAVELYHSSQKKFETTSSGVSITQDLDVDGHTNLDNVSVAGVSTFTGLIDADGGIKVDDYIEIFHYGGSNFIRPSNGALDIITGGSTNIAKFQPGGGVDLYFNGTKRFETENTGAIVSGILTVSQDLDVDGHTNLDNGNVAGIVTFNSGAALHMNGGQILLYDRPDGGSNNLFFGTGGKAVAYHDGTNFSIVNNTGHSFIGVGVGNKDLMLYAQASGNVLLQQNTGVRYVKGVGSDASVQLFFNNNLRLNTTNAGVSIPKDLDVDGHTNLDNVSIAGVTTTGALFTNSGIDLGGELNFTGNSDKFIDVATLNGNNTFYIRHQDGGTYETAAYFTANGASALQFNGNTKFATTNTGVQVTGNVTANHSNGQVHLQASDGSIEITKTSGGAYIDFKNDTSEDYDARLNEENGHLRVNTHFRLYDNKALELGNRTSSTYGDLRLYHDTNNSIIENFTGALYIRNYDTNSTDIVLSARNNIALQPSLNETGLQCLANGSTELFYDSGTYGTPKLSTTATGIRVGGEVAASQDYPDTRPSLDLNFAATKKLDSRIKYTRSGRASFINEKGLLEIVNSNVPRFDHDPVTRECKGLLIEAERTNLITYSNAPGMSSPNLGGAPQYNDTVNNITLPTGEKGDVRRYLANAGGGGGRWGAYSGNSGVPKTGSVWVRTVSGTGSAIIDVADGGGKTVNLTEEWQRVTTTHTPNNAYEFFDIYFATPITIYYWGVQIEEGAFMSSYIPTNNATATRGADSAVIDGQNFTDFYNPTESSVLAVGTLLRPASLQGQLNILHIGDGNADGHGIFREHGTKDVWYHIRNNNSTPSGGNLNPNGFGDWDANEEARIAIAFKDGDQAISVNGGNQVTASVTTNYPSSNITKMWIGSYGTGGYFEGTIKRITYYPKQLSDNQLNTITS